MALLGSGTYGELKFGKHGLEVIVPGNVLTLLLGPGTYEGSQSGYF